LGFGFMTLSFGLFVLGDCFNEVGSRVMGVAKTGAIEVSESAIAPNSEIIVLGEIIMWERSGRSGFITIFLTKIDHLDGVDGILVELRPYGGS